MPARECGFHVQGRCLYQERLNPGYSPEWKCSVLCGWERAFDDFLARAEAFGLEQREVNTLWSRRFERLARKGVDCPEYVHDSMQDPPGCAWQHESLCLLALPECEGRCRHYQVRNEKKIASRTDDQE